MKKLGFIVMPLMAISLLTNCGSGDNPGPTPDPKTVERTISFNIPNCKVYYGNDEIKDSVFKISVPDVNPYYAKFSLKGEGYTKPSSINITCGGQSYQDFEFYNDSGVLFVNLQSDLVIDGICDMRKTLDEYTWEEIDAISKSGDAGVAFRLGDTKKIQLKHQDKNGNGVIDGDEVYQTVRIIGINEDCTDINNPEETKIGLTFEFVDFISDENGFSLATYWNDTATSKNSNYNYKESTIREALNSKTNSINWFRFYGLPGGVEDSKNFEFAKESNYKISVLDMLPDSLTKEGILKTPSKYVNTNDGSGWKEETINDKLFLLSPVEMGETDHTYEESDTTTYSYYKDIADYKKIKYQIKWHNDARISYLSGSELDGDYAGIKYSEAGFNSSTKKDYGGISWLRSPRTNSGYFAWNLYYDGSFFYYNVYSFACAIAPAFCI